MAGGSVVGGWGVEGWGPSGGRMGVVDGMGGEEACVGGTGDDSHMFYIHTHVHTHIMFYIRTQINPHTS